MQRTGIQFTTSSDGTPIAYWTVGQGPPLVLIHNFVMSHAELEWEVPSMRSFYEALAEHHTVIRMDPRTTGLSAQGDDVDPGDDALFEATVADVGAVADTLGHDRFDLMACVTMGAVGVRLASEGRVDRLVLCDPAINIPEATEYSDYLKAAEAMATVSQDNAARVIAHIWSDLAPPADRESLIDLIGTNGRNLLVVRVLDWNAEHLLSDVTIPTLIVHIREGELVNMPQLRRAAATIPDATLVGVEGYLAPYWADRDEMLGALGDFLAWGSESESIESDFSVIVFTDVVASTEVVDRLGDEAARNAMRDIEDLVVQTAKGLSGTVIKHLGDGSLVEFSSASNAIDFAGKVQAELAGGELGVRIGMAAGEPIREAGDVHGAVVVVASRVADAAGSGEVFVSDGVRQLVLGKNYRFDDLGDHPVKGFDEPVRIWRLIE